MPVLLFLGLAGVFTAGYKVGHAKGEQVATRRVQINAEQSAKMIAAFMQTHQPRIPLGPTEPPRVGLC